MKLYEIQQKLKAPKAQYNSFGKYHYRNCEDILEAVKPLLGESVLILSDEIVNVGDRYYVKSTAVFRDTEQTTTVYAFAREAIDKKGMDDAQITGAASSYARKYALNGLFLIDDTKDADHGDNASQTPKTAPQRTQATRIESGITSEDKKIIAARCKSLGRDTANMTREEAYAALKELTGLELAPETVDEVKSRLGVLLDEKNNQ